eukprot:TRINITY_DN3150_c0_g2_i5.p1 TRINITY_DN3150_c0_g2~~TRINITY_DN3150_c0_g2_i5.p1  ORF type:complete len:169 (-),score=22.66 TRINITY_DN3150_c0_g2_i5:274-780(-)
MIILVSFFVSQSLYLSLSLSFLVPFLYIETKSITLGGRKVHVGKTIHHFRMKIFAEHLGLTRRQARRRVLDACSDAVWHGEWRERAYMNSAVLEFCFPYLPRNEYTTDEQAFEHDRYVRRVISLSFSLALSLSLSLSLSLRSRLLPDPRSCSPASTHSSNSHPYTYTG